MISFLHLHNTHAGETGIVICNGPSLRDVPLEFLRKYPSFGSNRIALLGDFTPTFYACVNPLVISQNKEEIKAIQSVKFIKEGNGFEECYELCASHDPYFSYVPWISVFEGFTITFVLLQLAYFIGFKTVLVVGCDHRFIFEGHPNQVLQMEGDDPNHFTPQYFKGQSWNAPNLHMSEKSYQMAREAYENDGRRIINLTPDSALDVFEKGLLEEWK